MAAAAVAINSRMRHLTTCYTATELERDDAELLNAFSLIDNIFQRNIFNLAGSLLQNVL